MKNCPNCGAPYETDLYKCPYCGTSYFDLSSIDFDEHKPVFLKLKHSGMYITCLAMPKLGEMSFRYDYSDVISNGAAIMRYNTSTNASMEISFELLYSQDKLITIEKGKCEK